MEIMNDVNTEATTSLHPAKVRCIPIPCRFHDSAAYAYNPKPGYTFGEHGQLPDTEENFYDSYDPMVGVNIAITLGSCLICFIIYVTYRQIVKVCIERKAQKILEAINDVNRVENPVHVVVSRTESVQSQQNNRRLSGSSSQQEFKPLTRTPSSRSHSEKTFLGQLPSYQTQCSNEQQGLVTEYELLPCLVLPNRGSLRTRSSPRRSLSHKSVQLSPAVEVCSIDSSGRMKPVRSHHSLLDYSHSNKPKMHRQTRSFEVCPQNRSSDNAQKESCSKHSEKHIGVCPHGHSKDDDRQSITDHRDTPYGHNPTSVSHWLNNSQHRCTGQFLAPPRANSVPDSYSINDPPCASPQPQDKTRLHVLYTWPKMQAEDGSSIRSVSPSPSIFLDMDFQSQGSDSVFYVEEPESDIGGNTFLLNETKL